MSKLEASRSMTSEPSAARTEAVQMERDIKEGSQGERRMVEQENRQMAAVAAFIFRPSK